MEEMYHLSKAASASVAVDEALLRLEARGPPPPLGPPLGSSGIGDIRPPPPQDDAFERVRGLIENSGLSG